MAGCSKDEQVSNSPSASASASSAPAVATSAMAAAASANAPKSVFDVSELDTNVNACQDFDSFTNAKWVVANPIPDDRTSWGTTTQVAEQSLNTQHDIVESNAKNAAQAQPGSIEQKIGWLYQSGMDETAIDKAGFDPIKPQLAAIDRLDSRDAIVDYIDNSFAQGNPFVFRFVPGADFNDAKLQIGYVVQGGLGLPTKDYYSDAKYADLLKAYQAYIAKTLQLTGVNEAAAQKQAEQVIAFETALAKASLSPTELRDLKNEYHFVSVKQANQVTPHFSWEKFFAAQGVTIDKGFSLSQPAFFVGVDKLLATAPLAQWQAYLRFHTIDGASPYLSTAFRDNNFEFRGKTLSGQPQQEVRWKQVLSAVNHDMGEALGQLYVAKVFTPEAKQRAEELVTNVRNALKARIENLDWMNADTKAKAIKKWDQFLPKIGYPDQWRDWSGLTIKADDYYGNMQAAAKFDYDYDIAKIGKPTDRREWTMTPQTVNAYYSDSDNTINFPAAILQPPFFYANGDDAVNYGGIGAIIGHEASHGFDDNGSQFDGEGNKNDWWTKEDKAGFNARTAKLVQQFNDYTPIKGRPDLHVNGKLTLGENIADLGGISVAYDALQAALKANPTEANAKIDGYTQDQRFFLSWALVWRGSTREKQDVLYLNANPHSPDSTRVIGPLSNMATFASAFQCKPGDAMVRSAEQQVKIW
jgi:putative endopeptidase